MRLVLLFCTLFFAQTLLAQRASKDVVPNNPFTHWDGTERTLTDIFKQHRGKVIYLDFWASWCGPCRKEMPSSKALHEQLGDDVVFVYISIDDNKDAWTNMVKRLDLENTGEHYHRRSSDMKDFLRFFGIYSIPHYMIIDKSGQFYENSGPAPSYQGTEATLRKLVKAKVKAKKAKN